MIQVISGHLGSGSWRFKDIDGVTTLAHMQAFTPHSEFRIGPDQVIDYYIEEGPNNQQLATVKINFTDERYCRAIISAVDINQLDKMVASQQSAPAYKRENRLWIAGLAVFFMACLTYEFVK